MKYQQFEIWIADLHPNFGEETGKTRPVLIVQSNILNDVGYRSTIICPFTTGTRKKITVLRINVGTGESGLNAPSAVMIDEVRAIDNRRFIKKIGELPQSLKSVVAENLAVVLDLDSFRQNQ